MIPRAEVTSERFLTFKRSKYPEMNDEVAEAARRIVERKGYTAVSAELWDHEDHPDEWGVNIRVIEMIGPLRFLRHLAAIFIALWFPFVAFLWLGSILVLGLWGPEGSGNLLVMVVSLWFARWHFLTAVERRERGFPFIHFILGGVGQLSLAGLQIWFLLDI